MQFFYIPKVLYIMMKTKTCQLCGSKFSCGGLLGCWCDQLKIDRKQRELISLVASDCVCQECLTKKMEKY
ncbi:cysteine-rich CWC family protein [Oxyplasma meridianum]|uniref:cysteine-rich CWC family protein n=1 Tax=Oxyplasma meridianum TaxID=3073602 RepID=UPI00372D36BC